MVIKQGFLASCVTLLLLTVSILLLEGWRARPSIDGVVDKAIASQKVALSRNDMMAQPQPPLVLISWGCSGSTFLIKFAWRLVKSHTGMNPFPDPSRIAGGSEFLATNKPRTPNLHYNYTLKKTDRFLADKEMVIKTFQSITAGASKGRIMVPKILNNQLTEGVGAGLQELGARVVMTYRKNLLERDVCRIRDCFSRKMEGIPVFENGTKADLCFQRRWHPETRTFAHINAKRFGKTVKQLMDEFGCSVGLENPETKRQIEDFMNLKPHEYPQLSAESLMAFEVEQVGTPEFRKSVSDWKKLLRGWGIEPDESLIIDEMLRMGIGSRPKSDAAKHVYNYEEVQSVLSNHETCDWSWMAP